MIEPVRQDGTRSRGDQAVAHAILRYLADHPQAVDTAAGIAEWWLTRQRLRDLTEQVTRVLDDLADRGVVERVGSAPPFRYRRRDDRFEVL